MSERGGNRSMKLTNKHFIDWESSVFGYGYGTGEEYTLTALKRFLELCNKNEEHGYNYEILEKELTPTTAWLLINILCHADIIEYGTSPRFGWLTEKGDYLKEFIDKKTAEDLYEMVNVDSDYVHCYPDHCNCEVNCNNPMFK